MAASACENRIRSTASGVVIRTWWRPAAAGRQPGGMGRCERVAAPPGVGHHVGQRGRAEYPELDHAADIGTAAKRLHALPDIGSRTQTAVKVQSTQHDRVVECRHLPGRAQHRDGDSEIMDRVTVSGEPVAADDHRRDRIGMVGVADGGLDPIKPIRSGARTARPRGAEVLIGSEDCGDHEILDGPGDRTEGSDVDGVHDGRSLLWTNPKGCRGDERVLGRRS